MLNAGKSSLFSYGYLAPPFIIHNFPPISVPDNCSLLAIKGSSVSTIKGPELPTEFDPSLLLVLLKSTIFPHVLFVQGYTYSELPYKIYLVRSIHLYEHNIDLVFLFKFDDRQALQTLNSLVTIRQAIQGNNFKIAQKESLQCFVIEWLIAFSFCRNLFLGASSSERNLFLAQSFLSASLIQRSFFSFDRVTDH